MQHTHELVVFIESAEQQVHNRKEPADDTEQEGDCRPPPPQRRQPNEAQEPQPATLQS